MYPGIGGRNLSAGLAVLLLSLNGQRRALGTVLMCWGICTGLTDTSICLKTRVKRADHLMNTVVVTTTGFLATRDFQGAASHIVWAVLGLFGFSIAKTVIT